MAHIEKCIEDLLRKSGKKAIEVHAAVWVPDSEANVCMHCKKTQFTVLNRRVSTKNVSFCFNILIKSKNVLVITGISYLWACEPVVAFQAF